MIAVAYAQTNIATVGDLEGNSDEEILEQSDSDDENFYNEIVTRSPFDGILEKVWECQISDLDEKMNEERDKSLYNLSTTSLQFLKYARVRTK